MRQLISLLAFLLLFSCSENRKTQEPTGSLPYESREVSFESYNGEVSLSGTLTTPINDSLRSAVILVSGSGPDERDYQNHFGHKPFLVLSHYLTQKGISVLRYDERGVGKSGGSYPNATYEDLVSDVAGGINYLRANGFQKVGLIGHSEGGGVAPSASLEAKADFLILMATDNDNADNTLIYQTRSRLKDMGVSESTSEELIETLSSLLSIAKSESDAATAKVKMQNIITLKNQSASDDYKKTIQRLGDANRLIDGFLDPKFLYRLNNDPKDIFKKVRVPVLALYGDNDKTVDVETNLPLIKSAFDSAEYEVKVFPGLGHLFMEGQGLTIAPEVMSTISNWILK